MHDNFKLKRPVPRISVPASTELRGPSEQLPQVLGGDSCWKQSHGCLEADEKDLHQRG